MTAASGRVCVTLNISGEVTHWYRYHNLGKVWRAACHGPVSDYEDTHRAIRNPRKLVMRCPGCHNKLVEELADASERANMWERLFHEPQ